MIINIVVYYIIFTTYDLIVIFRFDQNERSIRDGYADASSEEFNPPKVAPGSFGKTYSWKREGFTHCSASCLGG